MRKLTVPSASLVVVATHLFFSQLTFAQSLPVCSSTAFDPDGDGFGWENNASCVITDESQGIPEFVNQATGDMVNLVRAYWDGLVDFNVPVTCRRFSYSSTTNEYIGNSRSVELEFGPLSTSAPFEGIVTVVDGRSAGRELTWGVENGIYSGPSGLRRAPWMEIVDVSYPNGASGRGVRVWSSNATYRECSSTDFSRSFIPTGSPPNNNPVDMTPPDTTPPVDATCIDTDPVGDGWGWNGSTSCRVQGNNNIENTSCIDTDPVGDGWGWDGSASCRVGGSNVNPVNSTCIDTAPLGDGWGWDGTASCRVGGSTDNNPVAGTCIDTVPLGNGWGWNGTASCRVGATTPMQSTCDYTDADLFGGWGWDPVNRMSCAPRS